ncbi:MAG: PEP-CTERM sorting domain-containing protein [Planctomycetota bacterium]
MITKPIAVLALASSVALTAPALGSVILVNDTFDDGTNPGYADPSGGGGTVSVVADTGFGSNALLLETTSNNRTATRAFSPSLLLSDVGDFVELDLDYRFGQDINDNFSVEFNLIDSVSGVEVGSAINPSAATNGGTFSTEIDNNAGRFDTIASGQTPQSLTFRADVTAPGELVFSISFDGGVTTQTSNTVLIGGPSGVGIGAPVTLDTLEFGFVSGQQGLLYLDNVVIESNAVIPEPTSAAAIGLGLLGLTVRRRR